MDDGEPEAATGGDGDFDSMIIRLLEERLARMHDEGTALDEASDRLAGALNESLSEAAPRVVQALLDSTPAMLADHRRRRARYTRRIRRFWGPALDRYYAVAVAAEEAGSTFDQRHAPELGGLDHRFEALTGIHARACRTAFEVHHLLAGGFPLGALARCRTCTSWRSTPS